MDSKKHSETYHYSQRRIAVIINAFNDTGIQSIYPKKHTGRPSGNTESQKTQLIESTKASPRALGYPFNSWTLYRLKTAAIERGIFVGISHMSVKRILDAAGISLQRTKTWKEFNDPEFEVKKTHQGALQHRIAYFGHIRTLFSKTSGQ
jgi:transposase